MMIRSVIAATIVAVVVGTVAADPSYSSQRTVDAMARWRTSVLKEPTARNGSGEYQYSMERPEGTRHFWGYIPTSYNASAEVGMPLVFAFHGLGDDCYSFGHNTGMVAAAEANDFVLVYPCGWRDFFWVETAWNAGRCCAEGSPVNDVEFAKLMVQFMLQNWNVDKDRVYLSGFSNGAFMTETLLCEASDIFYAGASVSGTVVVLPGNDGGLAACDTTHEAIGFIRPFLHIHGNLDFVVPWDGDKILGFPNIPEDFARWGARLNCTGQPVNTFTNGPYSNQVYETCADAVQAELVLHNGGGHEWPSDQYFDTTTYIVNFLKKYWSR